MPRGRHQRGAGCLAGGSQREEREVSVEGEEVSRPFGLPVCFVCFVCFARLFALRVCFARSLCLLCLLCPFALPVYPFALPDHPFALPDQFGLHVW